MQNLIAYDDIKPHLQAVASMTHSFINLIIIFSYIIDPILLLLEFFFLKSPFHIIKNK
jgi:hypothetical protein